MSKRFKSKEFIDSDDPDDTEEKPKAKKARKGTASKAPSGAAGAAAAAGGSSVSEDETMIPLSSKRFVSVQNFRGKYLVSIREYYDGDDGQLKPGRKGISLSLDQWEKLKAAIPKIDEQIEGST